MNSDFNKEFYVHNNIAFEFKDLFTVSLNLAQGHSKGVLSEKLCLNNCDMIDILYNCIEVGVNI